MRCARWHSLCRRNLKSRAITRRGSKVKLGEEVKGLTFRPSRCVEQKCVYTHMANLNALNWLTALASAHPPYLMQYSPYTGEAWDPNTLEQRESTLRFSVQAIWEQKPQYTVQKPGCRDTIVSEVWVCLCSTKWAVCPCIPGHQEPHWDKGVFPVPGERERDRTDRTF